MIGSIFCLHGDGSITGEGGGGKLVSGSLRYVTNVND